MNYINAMIQAIAIWSTPTLFYFMMLLLWMKHKKNEFRLIAIYTVRFAKMISNVLFFILIFYLIFITAFPNQNDLRDFAILLKLYFSFAAIGHYHSLLVIPCFAPNIQEEDIKDVLVFMNNEAISRDEQDVTCTICLSDMEADHKKRVLRCGHQFHENCIRAHVIHQAENKEYSIGLSFTDRVLILSSTCPICRASFHCVRTSKEFVSESF